jgi:hypothetical protein
MFKVESSKTLCSELHMRVIATLSGCLLERKGRSRGTPVQSEGRSRGVHVEREGQSRGMPVESEGRSRDMPGGE